MKKRKYGLYAAYIILLYPIFYFSLHVSESLGIGKFINTLFPCVQNQASSMYCYSANDIITAIIVTIIVVILAIFVTNKTINNKK